MKSFFFSFSKFDDVVSGNLLAEESDSEVESETEDNFLPSKKPAWVDEDDDAEEV